MEWWNDDQAKAIFYYFSQLRSAIPFRLSFLDSSVLMPNSNVPRFSYSIVLQFFHHSIIPMFHHSNLLLVGFSKFQPGSARAAFLSLVEPSLFFRTSPLSIVDGYLDFSRRLLLECGS